MIITYALIAIIVFVFYVKWKQTYWERNGVPTIKPEFFFGSTRRILSRKVSASEVQLQRYKELKKLSPKHGGFYFFWHPFYVVLDPALVKIILQKDFNYFMGHGFYYHPKDILTMNLFNLDGERWKELRVKLTPTFTSGKMKMMFETLMEKTQGLEKLVEKYAATKEPFTIKEIAARFTTDIIASCAFGIECNSLQEPDNEFRRISKHVFEPALLSILLRGLVPWPLIGNLGHKTTGHKVTNFFIDIVKQTIKSRESSKIIRKDFMHLLLQMKNQDSNNTDNGTTQSTNSYTLTENEIIAQCFIFYLAGFETSSTTMTFAMLELSRHPDIQEKTRQEINRVLAKHDGKVTYEAIMEMRYLEMVIYETLRKYPPLTGLPRSCTKDYKIPDTNLIIKKGTKLEIPIWGIHMDPEYYPDPEKFDPERFTEENKASRPDFTFLPFGEGPRMCIGLRFGMLQTKMGLISLLRNFRFTLNEKTPFPIKMQPSSVIITVEGDVWVEAEKI